MIKKRLEASVQSNRNKFTFTLFKRIFFTNRLLHRKINYIQECNFHFQHRYSIKQIIMCSPMLNFSQSFTFKSIPKCFHKKEERERERKSAEVF